MKIHMNKKWLFVPAILLMLSGAGASISAVHADAFYNTLTPTKVMHMLSHNRSLSKHETIQMQSTTHIHKKHARKTHKHSKRDAIRKRIGHDVSSGQKAALVKSNIQSQNKQIQNMPMKQFAQVRKSFRYNNITPNTRDLGGYMGRNGRYIKPGKLIRSAGLMHLTKNGKKTLKAMNVRQIIDLRNMSGHNSASSKPDPDESSGKLRGTNAKYSHMPVYTSNEYNHLMHEEHEHGGVLYFYGRPSVTNRNAIKAYRNVFNAALKNNNGAILYHCDLGRDRTGTTSILLLSALGVNKNTIYHDYMLTNYYHYHFNKQSKQTMKKRFDKFYRTIDKNYGSMKNYLHKGIGLTNKQVKQLDNIYLTTK